MRNFMTSALLPYIKRVIISKRVSYGRYVVGFRKEINAYSVTTIKNI